MPIDRTHSLKQFTALELLTLARAGRVYTSVQPLDDRGDSSIHPYPFVVMAGNVFDLSRPCDTWLVNAEGKKDSRTSPAPTHRLVGGMFELDFSSSALRQAYMDYARQRQFFMVFKPSVESMLHVIGVGATVDKARLDAITRLEDEVTYFDARGNDDRLMRLMHFQLLLKAGDAVIAAKYEGDRPLNLPWFQRDCDLNNVASSMNHSLDFPKVEAPIPRSQKFRHQRIQSTTYPRMKGT